MKDPTAPQRSAALPCKIKYSHTDIYISQGSVAEHVKCGRIFNGH